jgi:hypothetical protein
MTTCNNIPESSDYPEIKEEQLNEGIMCSISFRAGQLTDYQKEKIFEAIRAIAANDKPFTYTPSCGS